MDPEVTGIEEPQAPQARPDHDAMAAAIERRLRMERERAAAAASSASFDGNHEKRQEFRRMIDPGILRPNPRHIAMESLQVQPFPVLVYYTVGITCVVCCPDALEVSGEHHRTSRRGKVPEV